MIKELLNTAESKMQKTISVLTSDLTTLKAGRANPKMLDRIQVEAYGGLCPIEQVGNISAPEPRMLVITPWDKSLLKEIEKAILKSDLGINPSNDGSIIRLLVPELTEETRKNLVKNVKKLGEDAILINKGYFSIWVLYKVKWRQGKKCLVFLKLLKIMKN